jgi:FtsP/CotA-like multicopper oxidase with cupredoxin domain
MNPTTMRLCLALWLIALSSCRPSRPAHEKTVQHHFGAASATPATHAITGESPPEVPPLTFSNPAEAIDLDPAPDAVHVSLTATAHEYIMNNQRVQGYAYNGQVPGPVIRAKPGDVVTVDVHNQLEDPTTVHWHGLHVPFAMDGVVWQGSPIAPDGSFTYRFTVEQTGTYWYHPHFDTKRQIDLGLYGMFIIEEPAAPEVDEELLLVFDSWHEEPDRSGVHDHSMIDGARLIWTVNGALNPEISLPSGSVVRARLLNVSNAGYLNLRWDSIRQIGSDQGLLPSLQRPDSLLLAPGDRVDVELLVGSVPLPVMNHPYTLNGGDTHQSPQRMLNITPTGLEPSPAPAAWPFVEEAPTPDPSYADWVYTFHGDSRNGNWMINGETFPLVTIKEYPLNAVVILEIRNLSSTEHPFHLHGHGFEVLSRDGVPPAYRTIEDNVNVGVRETLRIRLHATNPGDWMTHCHILPHADGGMMTVLRVLDQSE